MRNDDKRQAAFEAVTASACDYLSTMLADDEACVCDPGELCPLCRCKRAIKAARPYMPVPHKVWNFSSRELATKSRRKA